MATQSIAETRTSRPKATSSTLVPKDTETPLPSIKINPAGLQGVTVRLWHPWFGQLGEQLQALVGEFNVANEYNVVVEGEYQGNYNDLYDKVDAALLAGGLPNLAVGYNYQIQAWRDSGGAVVDLEQYVNDPDWGFSLADQEDFYPVFWQQDMLEGVRLGVPALRYAQLMYYNVSWAKELGFPLPPDTPEEFKTQACAAARANNTDGDPENNGTGGWLVNTEPSAILGWVYAFGGEVVSSGKGGYRFNTSQTEDAIAFLKDLYDGGCTYLSEGSTGETEFASRQVLFITASVADLPYQATAMERAGNGDQWTVIPFPSPQKQPAIPVYGPSLVVFASNPEEQLAAWLFLKWFLSPPVQAHWVEANGTLPIRATAMAHLEPFASNLPQWSAAVELLPSARAEPRYQSWSIVRWALGDVGTQTFRPYFTPDRIPAMLELLDNIAQELHLKDFR